MKALKFTGIAVVVALCGFMLSSFFRGPKLASKHFTFPYKQSGLTERQAAAHLLNRFTYGATPGQIDAVVKMGLENWFEQQLNANLNDDSLNHVLDQYPDLKLSNSEISAEFPRGGQVARIAIKEGIVSKDSVNALGNNKEYREKIKQYMDKNGLKPQQELMRQFINQKILRAAYSNNQLQEVLTDFWFNHFNVSFTKNQCAEFIPNYERDAIRPNVLGKFDKLLLATAKSPAMLFYLDLSSSVGNNTNMKQPNRNRFAQMDPSMMGDTAKMKQAQQIQKARKAQGLNENYAREVMELHTLGVDGGYTQSDVTQAARVLTGWTVYPMKGGYAGDGMKKMLDNAGDRRLMAFGAVHDGDFLFTPNRHDSGEKKVLGVDFPAGGGYDEGVKLLEMLAHNPSTAKFITKKLAVRFVSDAPDQTLLNKMSQSFTDHDGDIKEVMITMASSPEFWSKDALREKTKSPFELAISSVRSLNATVKQPFLLNAWITKMGQKMYYYQAPTGFPDKGQYWINTGALLNRMNFGLALATQRIPGITFDLAALNNNHEPESKEAALSIYGKLFIPERDLTRTIKYLTPMLDDPNLVSKVGDAASKTAAPAQAMDASDNMMMTDKAMDKTLKAKPGKGQNGQDRLEYAMQSQPGNNTMLAQVVGVIIGSPEYQRR
jgi:uncharacterized protein (DUF1800 family)